ncbi:MAG: hypothetical protein JW861_13665 [Bacteroidales bacterium]|nr:hypothetical protein [Bacteroidales bacterium]
MKEAEILQEQIRKLDRKDFDLEAWKEYTIVILGRIFGENNQKIRQIEKLQYDYSSWALRDTTGNTSYLDSCKKLGREILNAAIDELNILGPPRKGDEFASAVPAEVITTGLEEELKVSQYREIAAIINKGGDPDEIRNRLKEKLDLINPDTKAILLSILAHPALKGRI